MKNSDRKKQPSLFEALIPVLLLIVGLFLNYVVFGDDVLSGSNQLMLIFSGSVAAWIAMIKYDVTWEDIQAGIKQSLMIAMPAILILLIIGALVGTWFISGIVPTMIYYGLDIVSPTFFLVTSCILCSIVSICIGSSWTTTATIGVALLGIGSIIGVPMGLTAGAIISGAYFGDKMSPLSDTTNLASAVVGADLFKHIQHMRYTTIPSILMTLMIFMVIGFFMDTHISNHQIQSIQTDLKSIFHITPWLFIVPCILVWMIVKKVPALPALFLGVLLGCLAALIAQPELVKHMAGEGYQGWQAYYVGIMKAMYTQTDIESNNKLLNELIHSKGMSGMLNTIWLVICAMIFGGIMEVTGFLKRITDAIFLWVRSTGSLITSTAATCCFFNLTASDQYISITVPGRMYANAFREKKLAPENLSRTLEDSGTVTSVLVPWNTCNAYQAGVLALDPLMFIPYCFFNILSPIMTITLAYLNKGIKYLSDK